MPDNIGLLPDLDQGISELLDSLRCNLALSDGPKHNVPRVLHRIRSGMNFNILHTFGTRPSIVVDQMHQLKV